MSNPDSALFYATKAYQLADEFDLPHEKSNALRNMGTAYLILSNYDQALEHYQQAYALAKQVGYEEGVFKALNNIGLTHLNQGNYYFALENLYTALQLKKTYNKTSSDDFNLRTSLSNIGKTYFQLKDYKNAEHFTQQALEVAMVMNDQRGVIDEYLSLSQLQRAQGNTSLAYQHVHQAHELTQKVENNLLLGNIYLQYAILYYHEQKLNDSADYLLKALEIFEELKNKKGKANVYQQMASICMQEGLMDEARQKLEQGLTLAQEIGAKQLLKDYYKLYADYYQKLGQYEKALTAYQISETYQDSLFNEQSALQLKSFHLRIQDQENQKILISKDLALSQQEMVVYALAAILILIIALTLAIVSRYRLLKQNSSKLERKNQQILYQTQRIEQQKQVLKKRNQELQEAQSLIGAQNTFLEQVNAQLERKVSQRTQKLETINQELETLIYRASHDLKSPLTSVLGLVEVARLQVTEPEILALFEKIRTCTTTQQKVLTELFESAQIRLTKLEVKIIDLEAQLLKDFQSLQQIRGYEQIRFSYKLNVKKPFFSDHVLLSSILQRAFENAVHFRDLSKEQSVLQVDVSEVSEGILIRIFDNGIGMEKGLAHKAFEIFFRASNRSSGNGLGLYIAKKAVERLQGSIEIDSKIRQGTTVSICLPSLSPNEEEEVTQVDQVALSVL
jgi:signal transduction histidine kinase